MNAPSKNQARKAQVQSLSIQIHMAKTYRNMLTGIIDPTDLKGQVKLAAADHLIQEKQLMLAAVSLNIL